MNRNEGCMCDSIMVSEVCKERWSGYGIEKREDERLGVENRIEKKWMLNSFLEVNDMGCRRVGSQKGLFIGVIGV